MTKNTLTLFSEGQELLDELHGKSTRTPLSEQDKQNRKKKHHENKANSRKVIRAMTLPCTFKDDGCGNFCATLGKHVARMAGKQDLFFQGDNALEAAKDCYTRDCASFDGLPDGQGRILSDYFH